MPNKSTRKLLVQFISTHGHIHCVEIEGEVWQQGVTKVIGDIPAMEEKGRELMREQGKIGAWGDVEKDFDLVGVLSVVMAGAQQRGRITWVEQAEYQRSTRPVFSEEEA